MKTVWFLMSAGIASFALSHIVPVETMLWAAVAIAGVSPAAYFA